MVSGGTFNHFTERKLIMTKNPIFLGVAVAALLSLTLALTGCSNVSAVSGDKAEKMCDKCATAKATCCCGEDCKCCDGCKTGNCTCGEDCQCCCCCKPAKAPVKTCCCGEDCKCCDGCKTGNCTCGEECKCCGCCIESVPL